MGLSALSDLSVRVSSSMQKMVDLAQSAVSPPDCGRRRHMKVSPRQFGTRVGLMITRRLRRTQTTPDHNAPRAVKIKPRCQKSRPESAPSVVARNIGPHHTVSHHTTPDQVDSPKVCVVWATAHTVFSGRDEDRLWIWEAKRHTNWQDMCEI